MAENSVRSGRYKNILRHRYSYKTSSILTFHNELGDGSLLILQEMLSSLDIHTLSSSSLFNVVVKDNSFADISEQISLEIDSLRKADLAIDDKQRIFQPAGFGKGDNNQVNSTFRSDLRCWVTPDLCREHKLSNIETLIKRLIKVCSPLKETHKLNGDYSAQLTLYPGNGTHYVRHLDSFTPSSSDVKKGSHRKLTLLFYLNPTHEGGHLRLYHNEDGVETHVDIEPILNRLVIFRSDTVEHEVLSSFSDRIAISLWASSSLPPQSISHTIKSNTPIAAPIIHTVDECHPPPLSIPQFFSKDSSHVAHTAKIFVSMVNYRDSEGPHTIRDLFAKAANPQRIFMGIVFQGDPMLDVDCMFTGFSGDNKTWNSQIRTIQLSHQDARGPCLARHIATSLWQGEEYFLQIDSHMRFRKNWDTYLIGILENVKAKNSSKSICKPVVTTYPLGYTLPNNIPDDIRPTVLVPIRFDDDGMLRQSARVIQPTSINGNNALYVKSPLWASGFSFSDSSLIHEVPYNPHLNYLFFGEELSMAVRMFTCGYDFYAPTESIIYHLYSRAHRPTFQEVQPINREMLKAQSQYSVRSLLGIPQPVCDEKYEKYCEVNKRFGLGAVRSVAEFEASVGVSFNCLTIDSEKDWNQYINQCNDMNTAVSYRFVSSGDDANKSIEELSNNNNSEVGSKDLLSALSGLDRVKQFLGTM